METLLAKVENFEENRTEMHPSAEEAANRMVVPPMEFM